jgi:hypothetical protein
MKRLINIIAVLLVMLLIVSFTRIGGARVVGFRYSVPVNNLTSECPDTVVGLDGRMITLADGRVFEVEGIEPSAIAEELKDCESHVRIEDDGLQVLRPLGHCGFDRPERCQWFTIPLIRVDLRQFTRREVAVVRRVGAAKPTTLPSR